MQNRKQFTFYRSFFEGISRIKNKTARCDAYDAIVRYALDGEIPELEKLPDAAATVFSMAKPNLDCSRRKAEGGAKSTASTAKDSDKIPSRYQQQEKEQVKEQEKEQMLKENIEKKSRVVFKAPTVEEVAAYCRERNNGIDPTAFIDYYQQQKWKLSNGNPMSDWKAAVRNWEHRHKNDRPTVTKRNNVPCGGHTDPAVARAAYLQLCEELGEDPEATA